jgi:hypothetical protein
MLIQVPSTTRSTPRHAVDIPCEVITSTSDEPSLAWATDMSADGLWIEDRDDLEIGEDLVVSFKPGIWWRAQELTFFANVVRLSPGLREEDRSCGFGIEFLDLTPSERWALRAWLRPRPPKAPSRRRRGHSKPVWPAPVEAVPLSPFARRLD